MEDTELKVGCALEDDQRLCQTLGDSDSDEQRVRHPIDGDKEKLGHAITDAAGSDHESRGYIMEIDDTKVGHTKQDVHNHEQILVSASEYDHTMAEPIEEDQQQGSHGMEEDDQEMVRAMEYDGKDYRNLDHTMEEEAFNDELSKVDVEEQLRIQALLLEDVGVQATQLMMLQEYCDDWVKPGGESGKGFDEVFYELSHQGLSSHMVEIIEGPFVAVRKGTFGEASTNQSSGIVNWQLWTRESLIKLWQFWSILLWYAVKKHRGRSVDVRRKLKDLRRYWRHHQQQRRLEDLSEKRKTRMLSVMQLLCKYGARLNLPTTLTPGQQLQRSLSASDVLHQSGDSSDLSPHGTCIRKSASVGMLPREQAEKKAEQRNPISGLRRDVSYNGSVAGLSAVSQVRECRDFRDRLMMLQGCGKDSSTTVDHQTNDSGEKSQPPTGPVDWKDWVEDRSHKLQRPPEQDDNFRELQRRMLIQVLMTWEEEGLVPEGDNPNAYRELLDVLTNERQRERSKSESSIIQQSSEDDRHESQCDRPTLRRSESLIHYTVTEEVWAIPKARDPNASQQENSDVGLSQCSPEPYDEAANLSPEPSTSSGRSSHCASKRQSKDNCGSRDDKDSLQQSAVSQLRRYLDQYWELWLWDRALKLRQLQAMVVRYKEIQVSGGSLTFRRILKDLKWFWTHYQLEEVKLRAKKRRLQKSLKEMLAPCEYRIETRPMALLSKGPNIRRSSSASDIYQMSMHETQHSPLEENQSHHIPRPIHRTSSVGDLINMQENIQTTLHDIIIETVFPICAISQPRDNIVVRDAVSWYRLTSGEVHDDSRGWRITSGSRAEHVAMENDWGHPEADEDWMFLLGAPFGVHVPGNEEGGSDEAQSSESSSQPSSNRSVKSCLEYTPEGCPPAYTRFRITNMQALMNHSWMCDGLILEHDGYHWLHCTPLNEAIQRSFSKGLNNPANQTTGICGPAGQAFGGDVDIVPTLVTTTRHPAMDGYLSRRRNKEWPSKEQLKFIKRMPICFVLVGPKDSPVSYEQARLSWSIAEILLIVSLPDFIRQGYIAFKYAVKAYLKLYRGQRETPAGRSSVCSYHLKTTFLYYLEKSPPSKILSVFDLMLSLCHELAIYLNCGNLPNYFIPDCNLLEKVERDERQTALQAIRTIVSDPVSAILKCSSAPTEIYGDTSPDDLVDVFHGASMHPVREGNWKTLLLSLSRLDAWRHQKFREQLNVDKLNTTTARPDIRCLVDMLR